MLATGGRAGTLHGGPGGGRLAGSLLAHLLSYVYPLPHLQEESKYTRSGQMIFCMEEIQNKFVLEQLIHCLLAAKTAFCLVLNSLLNQ